VAYLTHVLNFSQRRLQQPGWYLLHSVCIFHGDISSSHLASSYVLGSDCATVALSVPLADSTLAGPSARAGAVNDPPRLYTSAPEGRLPSRLCLHSISLPVCVRAPHLCVSVPDRFSSCSRRHSQPPPFRLCGSTPEGSTSLVFMSTFTAPPPPPPPFLVCAR
jgi:hypothetical protein